MKKKSEKKSKIDLFSQIKSVFILKKLYDIIETKKLSIVKYNKNIQNRKIELMLILKIIKNI